VCQRCVHLWAVIAVCAYKRNQKLRWRNNISELGGCACSLAPLLYNHYLLSGLVANPKYRTRINNINLN
jgi:hypothetical protein